MTTVDLPLLPLGRGRDLETERGVECPGDLPEDTVREVANHFSSVYGAVASRFPEIDLETLWPNARLVR